VPEPRVATFKDEGSDPHFDRRLLGRQVATRGAIRSRRPGQGRPGCAVDRRARTPPINEGLTLHRLRPGSLDRRHSAMSGGSVVASLRRSRRPRGRRERFLERVTLLRRVDRSSPSVTFDPVRTLLAVPQSRTSATGQACAAVTASFARRPRCADRDQEREEWAEGPFRALNQPPGRI
jgi:hypothetical protein